MYNATIYSALNDSTIVKFSDTIRFFLECKVVWYLMRNFPILHTSYDTSNPVSIPVFSYGRLVARIVFDELPTEPKSYKYGYGL